LIPGRIVAFGEDNESLGTELVSVVAETGITDVNEMEKLRIEILKAGIFSDIAISNVYFVPPRWLIKSSAGKPGRNTNKERILELNLQKKGDTNDF
jgi:fatty-acyl-CoA synthase